MVTEELVLPKLSTNEWEPIARIAQHKGPCIVSLEQLSRAHPSGIIALTLAAHFRRARYTNIILPSRRSKALRYLDRINFIQMANRFSVRFDRPVENLLGQQRRVARAFTQILSIDDPDYQRARKIISTYFQRHFADIFSRLWLTFTEVLVNIDDHSAESDDHRADHIIQVHVFDDRLELAFGDLGVGYLNSLSRNPAHRNLGTEAEAITKVIFEKASGLSHRPGLEDRGGGLREALEAIYELGGGFKLVSYDGLAYRMAGQCDQYRIGTMSTPFPGTLMAIQIPFR